MTKNNLLITVLVIGAALTIPSALLADTIVLKNKPALADVNVVSENYKVVEYKEGNSAKKKSISADEVLTIIYDNPPVEYRRGTEYFNLGDYVNAITRLKASLATESGRAPWVAEYAGVYLGRALVASAQFTEAIAAFEQVLAKKADTRWIGKISLDMALAHAQKGDSDKAIKVLDRFESDIAAKEIPGDWSTRARLMKGEVMLAAKRFDQSVELMKKVASETLGSNDVKDVATYLRAKATEAEALLASNDTELANNVLSEVRSKARQAPVGEAVLRNIDAALGMARSKELRSLLRSAELLSKVLAENFTAVSELPRTCYLLGLVHLELDGKLANAKKLAKGYFEETLRRFPESREAFLARDQLKKM